MRNLSLLIIKLFLFETLLKVYRQGHPTEEL